MNNIKIFLLALCISTLALFTSGCENTNVSGSMSYSMGMGYGYPMYYGPRGHHHTNVVVVKPPRNRSRSKNTRSKPARRR